MALNMVNNVTIVDDGPKRALITGITGQVCIELQNDDVNDVNSAKKVLIIRYPSTGWFVFS